jgi:hypothetical protein
MNRSLIRRFTRYWASLAYNKHIEVWEVGVGGGDDERFCALVRYQGPGSPPPARVPWD